MNSTTLVRTFAAVGVASLAVSALKRRSRAADPPAAAPAADRELIGEGLVVVANREPYIHEFTPEGETVVKTTAGGLVTAIEPLLRASRGTWVAHGSGSADRSVVAEDSTVPVPPHAPEYTLKRVFLTREEEEHYYGGFSNEALWPLCHNAFTKPAFRDQDWEAYRRVNERFAVAALECSRGVIVLQDYHFALAARYIRERDASQVIASFWHIPWPSPEIFAICPWKEDILEGLLALDLLGFHTRTYAMNFVETAARFLDCKVNRTTMSVEYRGRITRVRAVPISIEYPTEQPLVDRERERRQLGLGERVHLAIAVDRVDYTKGILERYRALERLFTKYPDMKGRFTLLQIAAPSRRGVPAYDRLEEQVASEAARLNAKLGRSDWQPVLLMLESVGRADVVKYYQLADSALVTPLHDGMNLVAKEYAATCTGDRGVLILSEFAGAAEELRSALIVNPFDVDAVADAVARAVKMPSSEKAWRNRSMHRVLSRNTIHDWSEKFFRELAVAMSERKRGGKAIDIRSARADRAANKPYFAATARA